MISFIYEYPLHEHDDSTKSNVNFLLQANYHIENNEYMMSHINQVFSLKNERKKVLIPVFTKYSVSSDLSHDPKIRSQIGW